MKRKYQIYVNEETRQIDIYKMWEPPETRKLSHELGDDPNKRVETAEFLAEALGLVPFDKTKQSHNEVLPETT